MNIIILLYLHYILCNNYHSITSGSIVCNGTRLPYSCEKSRWKISYLGIDENVSIHEYNNTIYIDGAIATGIPESISNDTILYPNGFRIALHKDIVYWTTVPKKVIQMTVAILLMILFSVLVVFVYIFPFFE
ncbi:hypothetical protein NEOKW01_0095 [Nematocida sp. AWRm80]|nr:hypothetical protein NEOKW01_0095 [Nematocida sp. AWRm80]